MASFIGIDIGTNSVKVVRLEQKIKTTLTHSFTFPTPYVNNKSSDIDAAALQKAIFSRMRVDDLRGAELAVNIPSSRTTVLVADLPKMTKKELEVAAVAEARKRMVPTPGPDSIFEYLPLEEVMVGKIPRFEMLIIKTEKVTIENTIKLFDGTGSVGLSLLSPTCYTITNTFTKDAQEYKQSNAFVDIGYQSIDITITKKGKLHFYRNIKFGVKDVFSHMSVNLGLDATGVEAVVRDKGIPEIDIDLKDKVKVAEEIMRQKYEASLRGDQANEVNLIELRMLWDAEIERMVNEIRRSLIYYGEQTHGGRVDGIFIFGGGSTIKGIEPVLRKSFSSLSMLNPFTSIENTLSAEEKNILQHTGSIFAPAVSLALSIPLAQKKKEAIDFLPEDIRKQKVVIQRQISAVLVAIIILALTFLVWLKIYVDNNILSGNIKKLEREAEKSQNIIEMLNAREQEKSQIDERLSEAQAVLKNRLNIPNIFKKIKSFIPGAVTFKSMDLRCITSEAERKQGDRHRPKPVRKYQITIQAFCDTDYESAVKLIQSFAAALGSSAYFENVNPQYPQLERMRPVIVSGQDVTLTSHQLRDFIIVMDLKNITQ